MPEQPLPVLYEVSGNFKVFLPGGDVVPAVLRCQLLSPPGLDPKGCQSLRAQTALAAKPPQPAPPQILSQALQVILGDMVGRWVWEKDPPADFTPPQDNEPQPST